MAGNNAPIFSKVGNIQGVSGIGAAAATSDYNCTSVNNYQAFLADPDNGSFVHTLRVKPQGATNAVASVLRIYVVKPRSPLPTALATPTGLTLTETTGGNLPLLTSYTVKLIADNHWGEHSAATASVTKTLTGANNALSISWNPTAGATGYDVFIGPGLTTGNECYKIETASSPLLFTDVTGGEYDTPSSYLETARLLGEISIPTWTASAAAALPEWVYPLGFALPPGYRIMVGLATALTASALLSVTVFGGDY